ncbi:hypothetical protein B9J78_05710 [bacterium Unc6]|nr:hypothetical protein [bacterium Unc6]
MAQEKILIINNNPDEVSVIKTDFEKKGYNAIFAYSGEEGIKKAHEESPDLIILEIVLPDISGFKVCEKLKTDPQTKNIPIIALTAKSSWKDISHGRSVGVEDYIPKPYEAAVLQSRVRHCLDKIKKTAWTAPIEKESEYGRKRILIASSDKELLKYLVNRFEAHTLVHKDRYTVFVKSTAPDAINTIHLEHPDLIILDSYLQGLDGYRVCERIKSSPSIFSIPLILIERVKRGFFAVPCKADVLIPFPVEFEDLLNNARLLFSK